MDGGFVMFHLDGCSCLHGLSPRIHFTNIVAVSSSRCEQEIVLINRRAAGGCLNRESLFGAGGLWEGAGVTPGANCLCSAPLRWGHPKDASKHMTEMGLVAHATFACDLRERSRSVIEHELFGSMHPKSREINYRT